MLGHSKIHELPHPVFVFCNLDLIQEQFQLLLFDIDRSHNVLILGLGRSRKKLSEDVQAKVTSDKPHEMITSHFRFIQRVPWRQFSVWKNQLSSHASQSGERRLTIKFAIAIRAIVSVLVREGFHTDFSR